MESIKKMITNDLKNCCFSKKNFVLMEKIFNDSLKYISIKLIIKNNKFYYNYEDEKEYSKRRESILELLKLVEKNIIEKNIKINDCVMFFLLTDSFYYKNDKLPFLSFAKPKNKGGLLYPDNTILDLIEEKDIYIPEMKYNKMYFRGNKTDLNKYNIRSKLKYNNKYFLKIELNEKFIPFKQFAKYKYLLNLPGNQPWSYRFKYLFLLKRLVINVDTRQFYNNDHNEKWINFFDVLFEENKDYINIKYDWYQNKEEINKLNSLKLIYDLKNIFSKFEKNNDYYQKIVDNGNRKVNKINKELLLDSMTYLIQTYSKYYL